MNKRIISIIAVILFISQIIGQLYAYPEIPDNAYHQDQFSTMFNFYFSDSTNLEKTRSLTYTLNNSGEVKTKKIIDREIIIGNVMGLRPIITNSKPDVLEVTANLENVYFLTTGYNENQKACISVLRTYYNNLPFSGPYDIFEKEVAIDKFLLPLTKDRILNYLSSKKITNAKNCFKVLVDSKILIEYPMLLIVNSEMKGTQKDFENNFAFSIKFEPEFINPIKPITYNLHFRKDPITVKSTYTLPNKDCKTNKNANFCYITEKDLEDILISENQDYISSTGYNNTNKNLSNLLSNFNSVENFHNLSFENLNMDKIILDLAIKREYFCFREENEEYTKIIFDTAKAYGLSLEQAFQLWAIISERSNCNYQINPNLYGFAQLNLKNRDSGNFIDIEKSKTTDDCSKCPRYKLSKKYPAGQLIFNNRIFNKGELCYACNSEKTFASRCDPNDGTMGEYNLPLKDYPILKAEICSDNATETASITTSNSKLPLQLEEEEQLQYLDIGNFKEINEYLLNSKYNGDHTLFFNYGPDGKINDMATYFSFLITAIKNNPDEYGSTILFASDYLKEQNLLIKNSRDKSSNPYIFENFIATKSSNINNLYILASLIGEEDISKKEQIYLLGDYPELFKVSSFFLRENDYIKTTREIRVLINYLAIKRKYIENPSYFSKFELVDIKLKSKELENKITTYDKLDHKYWETKKNDYYETLNNNNWKLLLKNKDYYNYDSLIKIEAKPNYPVTYITDFGQKAYLNGKRSYLETGAHAWKFDTKKEAIDNYNLIWEASDICAGKTICKEGVPTIQDCCQENKALQDGKTHLELSDIIIDGAILGIYNPSSKYNDDNREYTHLAMYIGKTIYGKPLITEITSTTPKISELNTEVRNRIKRIYAPKSTNIKSFKDVLILESNLPSSYVFLSLKNIQDLTILGHERKGKTDYYEDPNLEGEGDLDTLKIITGKCSIYIQKTLDEYINCILNNQTILPLNRYYKINNYDSYADVYVNVGGYGSDLVNAKYSADSRVCFGDSRKNFNKIIFSVAKKERLTEEETAQLWSKLAAESGCSLTCEGAGGCHGDGIGQVTEAWHKEKAYISLKKYLLEINPEKYKNYAAYYNVITNQDRDAVSATELALALSRYNFNNAVRDSKNAKIPITIEMITIYDNDNAINASTIGAYLHGTPTFNFKNGINPIAVDSWGYTALHKLGYYLAYKRAIYECYNNSTTNSFITAYKTEYGGTLCD